jgi:microcystin-dependent protein
VYKSITIDQLATFVVASGGGVSVGDMKAWPTINAPTGWVVCDGTVYATSTHPALSALLGSTYGGNGTSTFGVPDLKGRSPIGLGTGDASGATIVALAQKKGKETHSLIEAENGPHAHNSYGTEFNEDTTGGELRVDPTSSTTATGSSGSGTAHATQGPSLGINWVIKT